jgi:hypothetical protein
MKRCSMSREIKTIADYVAAFDAGETIPAIRMSSYGPDYERVIQLLVVELLRDNQDKPAPAPEEWLAWGNNVYKAHSDAFGEIMLTQWVLAKELAFSFIDWGIEATFAYFGAPNLRFSKYWPEVVSTQDEDKDA